jgi:hypothetical protein
VTELSTRPSVAANPLLVVASASKPSEASSFADPASHGFGIQQRISGAMQVQETLRELVHVVSLAHRPAERRRES